MMREEYTINNPLRVFTAFSGYDSQCMALDRLGVPYVLIGWSEIDKYAIQAHNAIHPEWADRNYGDISKIDWSRVPDFDLLTMSSPCQDFSIAGLQKGGDEGSGTRSSLLWECRKSILAKKPRYILFENVKALVSKKFLLSFRKWQDELESYGYSNFTKVLNAKDYGIPQNRERVFMVSILDEDASFHFPEPILLDRRIRDILEEDVDERYYLSEKTVLGIIAHCERKQDEGCGFSSVITTLYSQMQTDTFIKEPIVYNDYNGRVAADQSVMGTVTTNCGNSAPRNGYKIIEPVTAAMRGRNPQNPSDRTAGCPTRQRLEIGGNISNTVTTVAKDCLVVTPICLNPKVDGKQPSLEHRVYGCDGISTAITTGFMPNIAEPAILTPKRNDYGRAVRKRYEAGEIKDSRHKMTDLEHRTDGISNTITSVQKDNLLIEPPKIRKRSSGNNTGGEREICLAASSKSVAEELQKIAEAARGEKIEVTIDDEGNLRPHRMDKKKSGCSEFQTENESSIASTCISARPNMVYGESTSFRIRKLTEREVFRLMDVSEKDIDRIQSAGISRSQQYKLAGNSIVVACLYHIFRKLFIETECESEQLSIF